jgi:divalent metal cation (Fe/Co/Zn/Cd) transporter
MENAEQQSRLRESSRATGAGLARIASTLFLLSGIFAFLSALQIIFNGQGQHGAVHTAFPVTFYAAWICAVLGAVSTIVTLFVYSFRARWFWRMLVVAALLWAALPPLGTAIGVLSLVLLFGARRAFPLDPSGAQVA